VTSSSPSWKLLRRTALGLGLGGITLGALIIGLNLAGRSWIEQSALPQLEENLSKSFQRKVNLGPLQNFLPWEIQVGSSSIEGLGSAEKIQLYFNPLDVLTGQKTKISLGLTGATVTARQSADGTWDWGKLLPTQSGPGSFTLEKVRLSESKATLYPHASAPLVLQNIGGEALWPSPQNLTGNLEAEVSSPKMTAKGKIRAEGKVALDTLSGKLRLDLDQIPFNPVTRLFLPVQVLHIDNGQATGQVNLEWQQGNPNPSQWAGALNFQDTLVVLPALPRPIEKAQGNLLFKDGGITFEKTEGQYGRLRAKVGGGIQSILPGLKNGDIDSRGQYALSLTAVPTTLEAVQKTLNLTLPFPTQGKVKGTAQVTGPLKSPLFQGKFQGVGPASAANIPVQQYSTEILLGTDQRVRFSRFNLQGLGGTAIGSGSVDLKTQTLNFQATARGIQSRLLKALPASLGIGNIDTQVSLSGPWSKPITVFNGQLIGGTWPGVGQVTLRDNQLVVDQARFKKGGGTINLTGVLRGQQWQGTANLNAVQLSALGSLIPAAQNPDLQGTLNGQVQTQGPLDKLTAQGDISLLLNKRTLGPLAIKDPLDLNFGWDGSKLLVKQASLGSLLTAQGTVDPNGTLDLAVQAYKVNLSQVPLPLPRPAQGQADLKGRLTGTAQKPNFVGQASVQSLAVEPFEFAPLSGPITYNPAGFSLDLRARTNQDRLKLSTDSQFNPLNLVAQAGDTSIIGRKQANQFALSLKDLALERLSSKTLQVGGVLGGDFAYDFQTKRLKGIFVLEDGRYRTLKTDLLKGNLVYVPADGSLQIGNAQLNIGKSLYTLTLDYSRRSGLLASLQTENGTLESLVRTFGWRTWQDILNQSLLPLPAVAADQIGAVEINNGDRPLAAQLQQFTEYQGEQTELANKANQSPLPRSLQSLRGNFQGTLSLKIPAFRLERPVLDKPQLAVDITGQTWQWGNYHLDTVEAKGAYQNQQIRVDSFTARRQVADKLREATYVGVLNLEPKPKKNKAPDGVFRLKQFPVGLVQPFLPPSLRVRGDLTLEGTLEGTLDHPEVAGAFVVEQGTLNRAPLKQASGQISYRRGRVSIDDFQLATEKTTSNGETDPAQIKGSFPLTLFEQPEDKTFNLNLKLQNNGLALLNLFTDQIQWQQGKGNLDITVGGDLTALQLNGDLTFEESQVSITGLQEPIKNLSGRIDFVGDKAVVKTLEGQFSKGKFEGQGIVALNQKVVVDDPLQLDLKDVQLALAPLYEGELDGKLLLKGSFLAPAVSGVVTLSKGTLGLPTEKPQETASLETTARVRQISSPKLQNLNVVLGQDINLVQRPVLRFLTKGNLVLSGTLAEPKAQGEVQFLSGRLNLFSSPFYLERGRKNVARFNPEQGLDPDLDIRVTGRASEVTLPTAQGSNRRVLESSITTGSQRTVRITATVTGRASKFRTELRSSPPRTQDEIITLLGGNVAGQLGAGIYTLAGSALVSPLEDFILERLALDEFQISALTQTDPAIPGAFRLGVGLEVAKDLSYNFGLSATQNLTDPNQPTRFNIQYRFNDEILLRLGSDFKNDTSGSIEYETRF
jgi:translocation and assembly module TamB